MAAAAIRVVDLGKQYYRNRRRGSLTLKSLLVKWHKERTLPVDENCFWALRDVTFTCESGTMTGIIGSNGAGKTTLLKCLAGITKPTVGRVERSGRLVALIELGAGFHPEISGRENIFVNGIILGLTRREIEQRYDSIVEFSGLHRFIDQPLRTYSTGMYLRLGFSVAIHADPDVLLIDEILAVGDQAFANKCRDKILEMKERKKTVVFVTHDLWSVEKYCDRAVWIEEGRIREQGHPRRVIDGYLSFVASKGHEVLSGEHVSVQVGVEQRIKEREAVVQAQAQAAGAPAAATSVDRWGTREVEITDVRVCENGEPRRVISHGAHITLEMDYRCHKPVDEPVFGIGLFTSDGVPVYQSNTFLERLAPGLIDGEGTVIVDFPSVELLSGEFLLDVAVHMQDGYTFDYHLRRHGFTLHPPLEKHGSDMGIFRPRHQWLHRRSQGVATPIPGAAQS
ncbi:MAG: ABC transporter ATP-binding protein [Candidatus Schekmanbacteria bacterium]|nr:ABC transporter ATP-binding protein [Candidatus Schekmanbacteria bacterium]